MHDLSVSIVTYNSEGELPFILDSLKGTREIDFTVTVIDNHSTDGSVSAVEASGLDCKLIRSKENVGYGAANNIAIRDSDARYHLMTNPDIRFDPRFLRACVDFMDENPDVAILTPKMLSPDGSEQYTPKRRPTVPRLLAGFAENRTGKLTRLRSEYTLRGQKIDAPTPIDFCAGCFMFCRASMLKACGGFDERFFLYFEDADLTLRMQRLGRTLYHPGLVITHVWKRDNQKLKGLRHELNSMARFLWKWRKSGPAEAERRAKQGTYQTGE